MSGFPHSEICGSKVAHTSPQLIAACHVLHRLYAPRHPRIALTSRLRVHTTNDNAGRPEEPDRQLGRAAYRGILVWMINLSQICNRTAAWPPRSNRSSPLAVQTAAITASILRTHSQCQRGPSRPNTSRFTRGSRVFISGNARMVEPIGIEPMT